MAATVVIYREQGGSVMRFDSTASLNVATGAEFTMAGTQLHSGGSIIHSSGTLDSLQSGGCRANYVAGAENQTVTLIGTSGIGATISAGRIAPVHTASPGSLYVRSDGSMSNWYYNISSGTTGSVLRAAASA